jgi:hypothetical protein
MATVLALTIQRDRDDHQDPGLARLDADGPLHQAGFIGDAFSRQSHD